MRGGHEGHLHPVTSHPFSGYLARTLQPSREVNQETGRCKIQGKGGLIQKTVEGKSQTVACRCQELEQSTFMSKDRESQEGLLADEERERERERERG